MITYTRQRFTAATLTNGKYELTSERQTVTDQILFIPGVSSPLAELKNLLFKQGQAGGIWVPSLSPTMISSESFGTGVQTFLDLSGNGKNATQASSGSRPAWGRVPKSGRRQLLVNSGFLGAVSGSPGTAPTGWSRGGSPAGTQIYDPQKKSLRFTVDGERLDARQSHALAANTTYHFSAQANIFTAQSWFQMFNVITPPAGSTITFQQDNDAATTNGNLALSVRSNTQLNLTIAVGATAGTVAFSLGGGISGPGTSDAEYWNPQLEIASSRSTYQLSGLSAFDITESGQRDCYYLQPDGVDDGMATASIDFSGTDKVTVFAAVRKLSDTDQTILEHATAGSPTSTGAIRMFIGQWGIQCRRPTTRTASVSSGFDAPLTSVLTGEIRSNTYLSLAVDNGAAVVQTADQGADPFLNTPLYFFERSNATNQASLQCFGLIFAGGQYPTSTIQRVRRILSRYTPGVSL